VSSVTLRSLFMNKLRAEMNPTESSGAESGEVLPSLARAAIASRFGLWFDNQTTPDFLEDNVLEDNGACFVTLMQTGQLRGCIGSLQAYRPLRDDVKENALAAAFRDPRFKPLSATEYNEICIEVSLLSPMTAMTVANEEDALAQFQPGVDGIVLLCEDKRSTFLPQVWESLPEPHRFLEELKRKAGLQTDFWSDEIRLFRYHVDKWSEDHVSENQESEGPE
jgi:AmmeMemoRadiSam system protein A